MSTSWPEIAYEQFPLSLFAGRVPPTQLLAENILFFAVCVLIGMAGIWLGLGTWRSWHWRLALLAFLVTPLLAVDGPITSSPLPLVLLPTLWLGGVTAVGFRRVAHTTIGNASHSQRRRDRFRLIDLFAFVALFSLSMAALREPSETSGGAVGIGMFLSAPTIGAVWAIRQAKRRWLRLPIAIAAVCMLTWLAIYAFEGRPFYHVHHYPSLAAWCSVYLYGWLWSIQDTAALLVPFATPDRSASTLRPFRKAIGAVMVLVVALPALWLEYRLVFPQEVDPRKDLQHNVHQSLARLAKGLHDPLIDPYAATPEQLRMQVNESAKVTQQIGELVRKPSSMPEHGFVNVHLNPLRQLYYSLVEQALVAELDGDIVLELKTYLDLIWLGRVASLGGTVLDCLVGFAFEEKGIEGLTNLLEKLTPDQLEFALAEMKRFEAGRESWSDVWQRDQAFWQRHGWLGVYESSKYQLEFALFGDHYRMQASYNSKVARCRLLITELAIQRYRRDKGRLPDSIDALVPQYLNVIPLDPFSNQPLVFRPKDDTYQLYSLGPNRADDGGTPKSLAQSPVDWDILLIDPPATAAASAPSPSSANGVAPLP